MTPEFNLDAQRFYAERDNRTLQYIDRGFAGGARVTVRAGAEVCASVEGQLLLSTLSNLLARTHRHVVFELGDPDAALLIRSLCHAERIGDDVRGVAQRADPFGFFAVSHARVRANTLSFYSDELREPNRRWYLGVDRACATLGPEPLPVGNGVPADRRGAILAAILGAATVFKTSLGMTSVAQTLSAWNLAVGDAADPGPGDLPPVSVGRVLIVGGGAVASGLAYCIAHWGAEGTWIVVDGDRVKLHNTNRSLVFFPDEASWVDGPSMRKVDCLANYFPNCTPVPQWYDQSALCAESYDTVLGLANERDVRTRMARRNDPIQLQATTGRSWLSQLHRHVAGTDDCQRCRMADVKAAVLTCSEGATSTPALPDQPDAALPFLSVASGLMLASALQRLNEPDFWSAKYNTWRWDFWATERAVSAGRHRCRSDCDITLPPTVRQAISAPTIWSNMTTGVN